MSHYYLLPSLPPICHIIGLISGTSADGIDTCLVEFSKHPDETISLDNIHFKVLANRTYAYPSSLKHRLLTIGEEGNARQLCSINFELGRHFAEAVTRILSDPDTPPVVLTAVGSHGQTVYHDPPTRDGNGQKFGSTLQLGESSCIANACGVLTVSDFRYSDMSVGGQGAPLMPILDRMLLQRSYARTGRLAAMLNIGGISNISLMHSGCKGETEMLAFDCGPGNVLLDAACRRYFNKEYDENGDIAKSGCIDSELLSFLIKHPYLNMPPPKSTGREAFGEEYFSSLLSQVAENGVIPADVITTLTHFTSHCILSAISKFVAPKLDATSGTALRSVFVSGGGVHNTFLLNLLNKNSSCLVFESSAILGIDPDGKEALCFAMLAYLTLSGCAGNFPSATGAEKKVILGKIAFPPP